MFICPAPVVSGMVPPCPSHALPHRSPSFSPPQSLPEAQRRRLPVHVSVSGALGEPLMVTVWDDAGHSSSASTSTALVAASSRPLDEAAVAKAIGGFGGSPLRVLDLDVSGLALAEGLFASLAEVKAARREAVEGFLEALEAHGRAEGEARGKKAEAMMREARGVKGGVGGEERRRERDEGQDLRGVTKISVLCRTPQQVGPCGTLCVWGRNVCVFWGPCGTLCVTHDPIHDP